MKFDACGLTGGSCDKTLPWLKKAYKRLKPKKGPATLDWLAPPSLPTSFGNDYVTMHE
jgi:hypothetical protein